MSEIVEYGSEGCRGSFLRNEASLQNPKSEAIEEMAERQWEIEVRSLSGESTTVFISENKTIEDLKLLLIRTFPPASHSPNFHLFFQASFFISLMFFLFSFILLPPPPLKISVYLCSVCAPRITNRSLNS